MSGNNQVSHPKAENFWNLELQSSEMKLDSIDKITYGYYNNDQDLFTSGWTLYRESSLLSMESEKEMVLVQDLLLKQGGKIRLKIFPAKQKELMNQIIEYINLSKDQGVLEESIAKSLVEKGLSQ